MTALKKFLSMLTSPRSADKSKCAISPMLQLFDDMHQILKDHERRIKELEDDSNKRTKT